MRLTGGRPLLVLTAGVALWTCGRAPSPGGGANPRRSTERIVLAGSFPIGDLVRSETWLWEGSRDDGEGILRQLNRCKMLVFDRTRSSGADEVFPPLDEAGWPKLVLDGPTVADYVDKKGGTVLLGIERAQIGGSTTLRHRRTLGVILRFRKVVEHSEVVRRQEREELQASSACSVGVLDYGTNGKARWRARKREKGE